MWRAAGSRRRPSNKVNASCVSMHVPVPPLIRSESTRDDISKAEVKFLYLLQLPNGYFTSREFAEAHKLAFGEASGKLDEFAKRGITTRTNAENEPRFALANDARSMITVVLAGGVFDVLHLGHVASLAEAGSFGDVLVVVVATDVTVENFKGRKPVFPEEDRRALVESLKPVDRAILGYEDIGTGYEQILSEVKPDIVALGYDQELLAKTVQEIIQKRGLNCKIVRLSKYDREEYLSSSSVRQRLLEDLR